MKRSFLKTISTTVLLSGGILTLVSDAWAQDNREVREQRRALRAADLDAADINAEYLRRARESRLESIAFLEEILATRDMQGNAKAERLLRLAELYYTEGRYLYATEMEALFDAQEVCMNQPTPPIPCDELDADNSDSDEWKGRAISLYEMILRNYPQYQRADEATFFLAQSLWDIGEEERAVDEYLRLVRAYSDSRFVPDALVQLGEYYFDNNDASRALMAFERATRYRDSPRYTFAMYKLAWCRYNVGEYGRAIDDMKTVVANTTATEDSENSRLNQTLNDNALRDLVRFFADAGSMDEAFQYFTRLGQTELFGEMLRLLARTYFDQGQFDESILTYRRLIREDPESPDAPIYQEEIIRAYKQMDQRDETLAEIDVLRQQYGSNSSWARANNSNPEAIEEARHLLEQNLRQVAVDYQLEADDLRGRRKAERLEQARQAYSVYLEEFPDGEHTYNMRFSYGELLWVLEDHAEAYNQQIQVVRMDPTGSHSLHCSESAVYAAEEMREVETPARTPEAGDLEEIELTEWEANYIEAAGLYDTHFSNLEDGHPEQERVNENNRGFIYSVAYIYYNHNMLELADERFQRVIEMDECSSDAALAANLMMDKFTLKGDTAGLVNSARGYQQHSLSAQGNCRNRGIGSSTFLEDVTDIFVSQSFNLIVETYEASGEDESTRDQALAAEQFWNYAQECGADGAYEGSPYLAQALINTAFYAYETDDLLRSIDARRQLDGEEFSETEYYTDNAYYLGYAEETLADFGTASGHYEDYFERFHDGNPDDGDENHERAREAIALAGNFRVATGTEAGVEQGIANYRQFIDSYPDHENVTGLLLDIARIYFENEDWRSASRAYRDLWEDPPDDLTTDQRLYCRLMDGRAREANGQDAENHWRWTLVEYDNAVEAGEELSIAHSVAARIRYHQIQERLDEYYAMDISGPPPGRASEEYTNNVIQRQLTEKFNEATQLDLELKEIYYLQGGEWSLAAAIDLGRIWENFGQVLLDSFIPPFLTESQQELYAMRLEDQAFPQREKAANFYAEAIDQAFASNIYNEQTEFAISRLGELRSDEYPELREVLIDPDEDHLYTSGTELEIPYEERP